MVAKPASDAASALEEAGAFDPNDPGARERLALLEYLMSLGATVEELARTDLDDLPMLASRIALWRDRDRLTLDEVTVAAGADHALVEASWRAAGFPDPAAATDPVLFQSADVELFELAHAGSEFLGEEVMLQIVRVLGASAARIADACVSAFLTGVASPAVESDPSGLALAQANVEAMGLLDAMTRAFDILMRHHIEGASRPLAEMTASNADLDLVRRSVGFVDLVDSTAWTGQLDLAELSRALGSFNSIASEVIVELGGRVVKFIGDEVMFITSDAVTATEIALQLVEVFGEHDVLPMVRGGIASGEVLARDGDYSGPVVNLAARAAKAAAPSTLLVDARTAELLDDSDFVQETAGVHSLKGIAEPLLLARVTRQAGKGSGPSLAR